MNAINIKERMTFKQASKIVRGNRGGELREAAEALAERVRNLQARGGKYAAISLSPNVSMLLNY